MSVPLQMSPRDMGYGIACLPASMPVPGMGEIASNSFVIEDEEPLVVDTGIAPLANSFIETLKEVIDPSRVRWIWVTHGDPDHIGGLHALLAQASEARIVTTFLGAGKLSLLGFPPERLHVIQDGEELSIGRRTLRALRPPYFDAPETQGFIDLSSGTLFAVDAFGALLPLDRSPSDDDIEQGMLAWAEIDSPWLGDMDRGRFEAMRQSFLGISASQVLTSHLPIDYRSLPPLLDILGRVQNGLAKDGEKRAAA